MSVPDRQQAAEHQAERRRHDQPARRNGTRPAQQQTDTGADDEQRPELPRARNGVLSTSPACTASGTAPSRMKKTPQFRNRWSMRTICAIPSTWPLHGPGVLQRRRARPFAARASDRARAARRIGRMSRDARGRSLVSQQSRVARVGRLRALHLRRTSLGEGPRPTSRALDNAASEDPWTITSARSASNRGNHRSTRRAGARRPSRAPVYAAAPVQPVAARPARRFAGRDRSRRTSSTTDAADGPRDGPPDRRAARSGSCRAC